MKKKVYTKRRNKRRNTKRRNTKRRNLRVDNRKIHKKIKIGGGITVKEHLLRYQNPEWSKSSEHNKKCQICDKSIYGRQHHCRMCGLAVCQNCSDHNISILYGFSDKKINGNHEIINYGGEIEKRVCKYCFELFDKK